MFEKGKNVFVKTYSHYYLGKIYEWIEDKYLVLEFVSEIYRTGRLKTFFETGEPERWNNVPGDVKLTIPIMGNGVVVYDWNNALLLEPDEDEISTFE